MRLIQNCLLAVAVCFATQAAQAWELPTYVNRSTASQSLEADVLEQVGLNSIANLTVKYHTLNGANPNKIRSELSRLGPSDQFGSKRDAYLRWHISWNWPFDSKGKPDYSKVESIYKMTLFFPKLENYQSLSPQLKSKWKNFIQALASHEMQHVKHVLQHYSKIEEEIRLAARNEPGMDYKVANQIGNKILNKIRGLDREYDRVTRNGAREGVLFP